MEFPAVQLKRGCKMTCNLFLDNGKPESVKYRCKGCIAHRTGCSIGPEVPASKWREVVDDAVKRGYESPWKGPEHLVWKKLSDIEAKYVCQVFGWRFDSYLSAKASRGPPPIFTPKPKTSPAPKARAAEQEQEDEHNGSKGPPASSPALSPTIPSATSTDANNPSFPSAASPPRSLPQSTASSASSSSSSSFSSSSVSTRSTSSLGKPKRAARVTIPLPPRPAEKRKAEDEFLRTAVFELHHIEKKAAHQRELAKLEEEVYILEQQLQARNNTMAYLQHLLLQKQEVVQDPRLGELYDNWVVMQRLFTTFGGNNISQSASTGTTSSTSSASVSNGGSLG